LLLKKGKVEELFEAGVDAADAPESFDVALGFIAACIKRGVQVPLAPLSDRLIAIALGEIEVIPKVRVAFGYYLAKISDIKFPLNAVHVLLAQPCNRGDDHQEDPQENNKGPLVRPSKRRVH
jgi:hypothetical protein